MPAERIASRRLKREGGGVALLSIFAPQAVGRAEYACRYEIVGEDGTVLVTGDGRGVDELQALIGALGGLDRSTQGSSERLDFMGMGMGIPSMLPMGFDRQMDDEIRRRAQEAVEEIYRERQRRRQAHGEMADRDEG